MSRPKKSTGGCKRGHISTGIQAAREYLTLSAISISSLGSRLFACSDGSCLSFLGPILELYARFNVSATHIYEFINVHLRLAEHIELATFTFLHCIGLSGDQRSVDLNTR